MALASTLKSSTAAIPGFEDVADVFNQLGDAPDVASTQLRYIVHAQPMSHALQEANIDKFIPGLAVGNYAVPNLDGGYELFLGATGYRFLVAMTRKIHVKHLHDGTTEVLPALVNRDLLEYVADNKTGFKVSQLRETRERIETQWLLHMLVEGQYPSTRRYKGSNYKTGQAVNNIVSYSFVNGKYFPMLTLFREKSKFVQGKEGPRYEADVKPLGKFGQLDGPPTTWVHRAIELRLSMLGGAPFAIEPQALEPPAPPPAIEGKPTAPGSGSLDMRGGAGADDHIPSAPGPTTSQSLSDSDA
jgi:hypothetical protein